MFNILENIKNSFESLLANKMRAALSMLGIIIGVSSVVILNAMGNGSTQTIVSMIEDLGTNILTVSPGGGSSSRDRVFRRDILTAQIVNSIEENISGLDGVLPVISTAGQVVYGSNDMNATVLGVTEDFLPIRRVEIEFGENITKENLLNLDRVAVVGKDLVRDLFNGGNPIGQRVKMGNNVFYVVGIIEDNMLYNSAMFIPITTASIRVTGQNYYSQILVAVTDNNEVSNKQAELDALLQRELRVVDSNSLPYRITNQQEMLDTITQMLATMTLFLAGIAAISLLVGGIGVMNIMLVSVTERTKEIGIRKAIGASGGDILLQFLTEASVLSLTGGGIGILFSYFVCEILQRFDIPAIISINSIIMSFSFSLGIGLIFGIFPAYKAAQLRPIEALRFE